VHRILGFRPFHGLHLTLSPDTLEPRPDTEILVEAVLPLVRERCRSHDGCRILDLGTGTGAIALALLAAERKATALGTDISRGALDAAQRNAHINGVADRFATSQSDWFASLDGRFDLIVSNPPYIASSEIATLDPHVPAHDPLRALDGGRDGLDAYRILARDARSFLSGGGQVAVEIGWDQRNSVAALFTGHGFDLIGAVRDLGGNNRVLMFR
jgi:release factor glutamine methyltransferase